MRPFLLALLAVPMLLAGCGATPAPLQAPTRTVAMASVQDDDAFPAVGHVYQVDFGQGHVFNLNFHSMTAMSFSVPGEAGQANEAITVTPIRPQVFMVTWQESDKTTVTHVEDYQNGVVFTNITPPDGSFIHWKGTLKLVK